MNSCKTDSIRVKTAKPRQQLGIRHLNRRGSVLIYTLVIFTALTGIVSLAVDWAHVQTVKTEAQSCADATARAYMQIYAMYGSFWAGYYAPILAGQSCNPVDANSGTNATPTVNWGSWDTSTNTFYAASSAYSPAVQIIISKTAANGNGVQLFWGKLIGQKTCDVHASAIAALIGGQSASVNIPGTASPYLAGMPNGTTTAWGDTLSNATPYQINSVPVTPGTYITVTNVGGTASILPGYVPATDANGQISRPLHHGQNWDSNPNVPGPENGIADAVMPANALMGLFLTNSAPNLTTAPATVDWTQGSYANQPTYTSIQVQQPFEIGTGLTTGGTTKQFLVPPGATRMYLGIWDGVCYNNNGGNFTGTISVQQSIVMVK